jgi:hypothetical protein
MSRNAQRGGKGWYQRLPRTLNQGPAAMLRTLKSLPPVAVFLLGACATLPSGPSVLVLPGTGKNFDQFQTDDVVCRQFAYAQVGGRIPNQAAATSGVTSAVIGSALGAAAGAAIGGGRGAAIGAGTGLLGGSLAGTGTATSSAYASQERYDMSYIQCMYAKGNRVPVPGQFTYRTSQEGYPTPPPNTPPPPPPP